MQFPGFEPADFSIFEIPEFAGRMGAIRAQLRPKLIALGEALRDEVAAIAGEEIFPHAASHMRRSVNPPVETWMAFGRSAKGYKRYVHYRMAVSEEGVRVTVFVEDDSEDKPILAAALQRDAAGLLVRLRTASLRTDSSPMLWYTATGPLPETTTITSAAVQKLGETLATRKMAKFQVGIPLGRAAAAVGNPERFRNAVLHAMRRLAPLYHAASPGK